MGKYFIQFNLSGEIVTRFDDNPKYIPHPGGTVEVPATLWHRTVKEKDGVWKRDPVTGDIAKHPFPPTPLADLQQQGKASINEAAEQARLQFVTPGDTQQFVYAEKREEAARWQTIVDASGSPVISEFPWMLDHARRKNSITEPAEPTQAQMQPTANEWNDKASIWISAGRKIEDMRETANDAIAAVTDTPTAQADIDAIVIGITWPAPV